MEDNKRSFYNAIIEFFSPTSSFVFTLIGAVLSTLFAIKFSGDAGVSLFALILIIWFIFGITVFAIKYVSIEPLYAKVDMLKKELDYSKVTIEKQEKQLENQMYAIVGKYGEFGVHIKKNKSKDLMRKLVNNFTYIECVQIHDWSMRVEEENLVFIIKYDNSYVKEGVDINNINQQYYKVNKNIYRKFKRAIDYYKMYKDSLDDEIVGRISDDFAAILNNIPDNYTPEYDRIINIIVTILESILPEEVLKNIFNANSSYTEIDKGDNESSENIDEEEEKILEYKRTGILGAILMNSDYMYEYEKSDESKLYRKYFSFLDKLDNENKIITFVINSNSGENITYQRLLKDVVSYYECLYEYLK